MRFVCVKYIHEICITLQPYASSSMIPSSSLNSIHSIISIISSRPSPIAFMIGVVCFQTHSFPVNSHDCASDLVVVE